MNLLKIASCAFLLAFLTACGGGGGNPGTSTSGVSSGTPTVPVTTPTLTLSLVDANGVALSSNSIGSGVVFFAKAVVKSANGTFVANKLVSFSTSPLVGSLSQDSALTDTNGVARVQIRPVSVNTVGAGSLTVTSTVDTVSLTASLDYQTSPANVTLSNLKIVTPSITALQSSAVTVDVRLNGAFPGTSVVNVAFSASCGTFSPPSSPTSSSGVASTTYQASVACAGPITLTAQTVGAQAITGSIEVVAAKPANVVFSSASVPLLVSSAANGGLKQSTLKFQVVDSNGVGMAGQNVTMSLSAATISAGVTFSVGGSSTITSQPVTTDGGGFASVTVSSGGLPTPIIVTAALTSNVAIQAASIGVAVTSGRATQNAASLSATKLSIEGFRVDGVQTNLSMRVADRQGNPIPMGSIVNFVASHGLVQGSCSIDAASQCSVLYTSQGLRPNNGRVAVLAFMDGEESFVDLNGDNIWQPGETFYDVGTLFRDDDESGVYDPVTEQTYPGGSVGAFPCASQTFAYPSVANSCDGTWSSNIRVRRQIIVALATSDAVMTLVNARTSSGFSVRITDSNGNSMPTGTTVTAAVTTTGAKCAVLSASPNVVRNSSNGGNHDISLNDETDCATVRVSVTATTPTNIATTYRF